jgi:hypothetical protein
MVGGCYHVILPPSKASMGNKFSPSMEKAQGYERRIKESESLNLIQTMPGIPSYKKIFKLLKVIKFKGFN